MDIPNIITSAVVGIVSAGASAAISLRIGQSNFFRQRMWEKRAEAYSKVLESLARMQLYSQNYESYLIEVMRARNGSSDEIYERTVAQYYEPYRTAKDELKILVLSESFVVSSEAYSHLVQMFDEFNKSSHPENDYEADENYASINKCIKGFNVAAQRDLMSSKRGKGLSE